MIYQNKIVGWYLLNLIQIENNEAIKVSKQKTKLEIHNSNYRKVNTKTSEVNNQLIDYIDI